MLKYEYGRKSLAWTAGVMILRARLAYKTEETRELEMTIVSGLLCTMPCVHPSPSPPPCGV